MTRRLSTAVAGDLIDWTGTGVILKGNPSSQGGFNYNGDGTHLDWSLQFNGPKITGTGSGTFTHSCTQFGAAATPVDWWWNSYTGTPNGEQTMGFGAATTTQVTVTAGGGALPWSARGVKK